MKPKILVIVDVPGWALERTADNVMSRLKDRYVFEKGSDLKIHLISYGELKR